MFLHPRTWPLIHFSVAISTKSASNSALFGQDCLGLFLSIVLTHRDNRSCKNQLSGRKSLVWQKGDVFVLICAMKNRIKNANLIENHNLVLCCTEIKPAVESWSPESTIDFIHWAGLSGLPDRVCCIALGLIFCLCSFLIAGMKRIMGFSNSIWHK